jgi:hypothetical protein
MHRVRQQAGSYGLQSWPWNVASEKGMALLPRPVIAACRGRNDTRMATAALNT